MINIQTYIEKLIAELKQAFGARLLYVGLQGSYNRGEATESSDIDIMVVLDSLCRTDLEAYRGIIDRLGDSDKSCGFICGKAELANWNALEICQLMHTTTDYYGKLQELVPTYERRDLISFVKLSAGNLYHALCHRYVHAEPQKSIEKLPSAQRDVFFIIQNLHFLEHGEFLKKKQDLPAHLSGTDLQAWNMLCKIQPPAEYDFDSAFSLLLEWCKDVLERTTKLL